MRMNTFIDIISAESTIDDEGFGIINDNILASTRAYKEDKYGSEAWKNRSSFSEASSMFRFRKIPGVDITTDLFIVCDTGRYNILSVSDIKERGMYIEVLAGKEESSKG